MKENVNFYARPLKYLSFLSNCPTLPAAPKKFRTSVALRLTQEQSIISSVLGGRTDAMFYRRLLMAFSVTMDGPREPWHGTVSAREERPTDRKILRVGRLPESLLARLRSVKMNDRHSGLNELMKHED